MATTSNCQRALSSPELSYSLRQKAKAELNETLEVQQEAVTELRRAISTQCPSLEGRTDASYLVRFLRPKKYIVPKALNLYKNYHKIRSAHPEIFEDLHPEHVQHVWKSCFVGGLPSRDREGRRVMVVSPQHWKPQDVSLKDALRSLVCQLEYLVSDEETQINGIVLIADFSKFTFEQAKSLRPTYIQLFINLVQNAFPARFKGVYVLNQPWAFSVVMTLFKPFLSEKMKKRIVMIGDDLPRLQDFVAPEVLPAEFGGTQPYYSGQAWAESIAEWHERSVRVPSEAWTGSSSSLLFREKSSEIESVGTEVLGANETWEQNLSVSSDDNSDEFFDCEEVFIDSLASQTCHHPQRSTSAPVRIKLETTV
jgi:hypothetical protein